MSSAKGARSARRSTAPERGRGALDAFEARLRPATGMRWPLGSRLGPSEAIELGPADTDLLILHRNPPPKAMRGAVHESLMIELGRPLVECEPGALPIRRAVYRSGAERITYQSTRVRGGLSLIASSGDRYVLSATFTFLAPELDLDRVGPRQLAGTIHLHSA
jgi:hypothetical protein